MSTVPFLARQINRRETAVPCPDFGRVILIPMQPELRLVGGSPALLHFSILYQLLKVEKRRRPLSYCPRWTKAKAFVPNHWAGNGIAVSLRSSIARGRVLHKLAICCK